MSAATDRDEFASPVPDPQALLRALRDESRVVFDLDGTLYDTRDFERPALSAVVAWLSERSGRPLPGAAQALWSRRERDRHRPGLFDDLLNAQRLPVSWGKECFERFHAYPGTELESSVNLNGVLMELRACDRRIALVSNGNPELQKRKLDRLGMSNAFDACIFCDPKLPSRLKPSAWGWMKLTEWRGGHQAVYVGDDPVDAAFAAAGGASFVPFRFRNPSHGD